MNYRHTYHAGSFTDVFKHIVLTALVKSLTRKDSPFCYLDTHAGIGYYDLFSEEAKKTKESEGGIEKIIQKKNPPELIQEYLDCVQRLNAHFKSDNGRFYPGSPMVARYLMRPNDRIVACELHAHDYQALKAAFAGDKQTAVHHVDGYNGLKAFLPPQERRGLVLIDPPFENKDEYARILETLSIALKRWSSGIYAIWYPIKDPMVLNYFYRRLKQEVSAPILSVELTIYPDLPQHLNGSGMAIINPPWQLDETLKATLPWLWNALTINGEGAYHARFLK